MIVVWHRKIKIKIKEKKKKKKRRREEGEKDVHTSALHPDQPVLSSFTGSNGTIMVIIHTDAMPAMSRCILPDLNEHEKFPYMRRFGREGYISGDGVKDKKCKP